MAGTQSPSLPFRSVVTVTATIMLVATEFLALGIAAGWAIAGLLELGDVFEYVLMAVFALVALWGSIRFARSAWRLEGEHKSD